MRHFFVDYNQPYYFCSKVLSNENFKSHVKMKNGFFYLGVTFFCLLSSEVSAQNHELSAVEIVAKADQKTRGESSSGRLKMTIVRPTWSREVQMKSWTKGDEYALILITHPARDQGTAFLKRDREMWNWQPKIDRVIKLPPSMMMQSWMGSDFTNDDLVKQSSIVDDYHHQFAATDTIGQRPCHVIELIPKENAPVVWGKITTWIGKQDYLQLKTEFYDEEGYLVNTMYGKEVKTLGGRLLPSVLEVIPADEPGHKTVIEYAELEFDKAIKEQFFSIQNLKRVR